MEFGQVTFLNHATREDFVGMVKALDLKPPLVIKPNWGSSVAFTEARVLDWVLSAVGGEALVVESYGYARSEDAIVKGHGGSFRREELRRNDRWFLEYSGMRRVLHKYDAEYVNITEEVWAGRTAQASVIQQAVEDRYEPVGKGEMYSQVPRRLSDLRGGSLLSLAKVKIMEEPIVISLSVKNLFGMIPGPSRGAYHGRCDSLMDRSILDVNKIYRSLFAVKGIVEAVFTATEGMTLTPKIYKDPGMAWACTNTIDLDAVVSSQIGIDPHRIGHLRLAADCFGGWDEHAVRHASESRASLQAI